MARAHVDPYAVLGVAPTCSEQTLRKAYLRLARTHHPDRHRGSGAERHHEALMLEINAAWAMVDTASKRRAHDRHVARNQREDAGPRSNERPSGAGSAARARPDSESEQLRDWRSYAVAGTSRRSSSGWQLFTFAPPGFALAAVFSLGLGLLVRWNALVSFGIACAVFAIISLIALFLLRLTGGVKADRDAENRRSF